MSFTNLKRNNVWRILYDSLSGIEKVDLLNVPQERALDLIAQMGQDDPVFKAVLEKIVVTQNPDKEYEIERIYVIVENERLVGILYGIHVLKLKIEPYYTELVQNTPAIESTDALYKTVVERITSRIIKEKNSIVSPKEFEVIHNLLPQVPEKDFMNNIYCIDASEFSGLRLMHLCETRYFKPIKNEYSRKWNKIVLMKDFRVTRLFYRKHLLIGFCLYRKEDEEKFFWSGQFQEVLESLIESDYRTKKQFEFVTKQYSRWKQQKKEGIPANQEDFTDHIGKYIIAQLFDGNLRKSVKQQDWDVLVDFKKYRVNGHEESKTYVRRETDFNYSIDSDFDVFAIVIFKSAYELQNIFQVPKSEIFKKKLITYSENGNVISWNKLSEYDVLKSKSWSESQKNVLSAFGTERVKTKI